MAEFCKQCATNLGFEPDFVGLTTPENKAEGMYAVVLCEGCGAIQVDVDGSCITKNCLENHNHEPSK